MTTTATLATIAQTITVGIVNRESGHDTDATLILWSDDVMTVDVILYDWYDYAPKGEHHRVCDEALLYPRIPTAAVLAEDINAWVFTHLIDRDS